MTTALTVWISGMPFALIWLLWSLHDAPRDVWAEMFSLPGLVAALVFAVLWPAVLADVVSKLVRGKP